MNDEIKEILDLLRDTADLNFFAVCGTKEELENMPKCVSKRLAITDKQAKLLLDYITNLQHTKEYLGEVLHEKDLELEKIKNKMKEQSLLLIDYQDMEQKLQDYKSRCEKAVEYIKNCPEYLWANVNTKVLSNILNGRSDE